MARSRQRRGPRGPGRLRYLGLGQSAGFGAGLDMDAQGLVLRYEHLFERVVPP